jgi:hypothetical protein
MGKLDVSQYIDSSHGNLIEPPVAHQTVEFDAEPMLSAPLHKLARCIRIVSDVDCLIGIAIGESKPTQFLRAGAAETRIVQPGEGFLISAVAAGEHSSSGVGVARAWGFQDLSHALELIASPAACKQRLDALGAATAEAQERIDQAKSSQAELVVAEKTHREMLARTSAEHAATLAEAKRNR